MKISLQMRVETDKGSVAILSIEEDIPVPLTDYGEFKSVHDVVLALSCGCRDALKETVTDCQRAADWAPYDFTYS